MPLEIEVITQRWKHAQDQLMPWRSDAREDYEFAAIRPWREEDLARLEEEERPALSFDRIGPTAGHQTKIPKLLAMA
jgi:hypothetical protein